MLHAAEALGEDVGEVGFGRDRGDVEVLAVELVHEEELRVDVLGPIRLDVALLNLRTDFNCIRSLVTPTMYSKLAASPLAPAACCI